MKTGPQCVLCGKTNTSGTNRPHSLKRTKRTVRPNLQKVNGELVCTRCIRTKNKQK